MSCCARATARGFTEYEAITPFCRGAGPMGEVRRRGRLGPGAQPGTVARPRYGSVMIDHLGVQVADVAASLAFYLHALEPIGMREAVRFPDGDSFVVGLSGTDGIPSFWLSQARASETRELHVAFRAPDRAAVDAVHRAAV